MHTNVVAFVTRYHELTAFCTGAAVKGAAVVAAVVFNAATGALALAYVEVYVILQVAEVDVELRGIVRGIDDVVMPITFANAALCGTAQGQGSVGVVVIVDVG